MKLLTILCIIILVVLIFIIWFLYYIFKMIESEETDLAMIRHKLKSLEEKLHSRHFDSIDDGR